MKYKFVALLFLAGCAGQGNAPTVPVVITPPKVIYPNILPTTKYWEMAPGTYAIFCNYSMHAVFHPDTLEIEVLDKTYIGNFRITNLAATLPNDPTQVGIVRMYSDENLPVLQVAQGLTGGLFERTNGQIIGEAANSGSLEISPPEALATVTPVAGEVLIVNSKVTGLDGGQTDYQTEYKTQEVTDTEIRTTLIENPNTPQAFAYAHKFDGELEELDFGLVKPDNTIDGYVYKRISKGVN